eukprot:gene8525-9225_t
MLVHDYLLQRLPLDILLSILDYINHESRLCFAGMNKALACSILRKVRNFNFRLKDLEVMDEEMRKRFFALFEYPYFQFTLVDDGSRSAHLPPISAAHVVETSNISLLRQLAKVYEFRLHSRTEEELTSLLRVLYLKARLTNLRMKRLMIIEGHQLSQLPIFQGLESLHLLYFRQLKATERITGFYSLPPNRLQKVRISDCIDFNSFENMENIQIIELKSLQSVFTLQGLGQNNRVVRLESMSNLDDISSLKDAKRVEICDCPRAVNTLNSLKNVQEIKLCSASLIYHCTSHKVTDCFYQMKELTHLQELELTFQARITQIVMISGTFLGDLWRLVQSCTSIKKVVIHSENFRSTGLMGEQLIEAFMIDYSHPKQLVLLRKNVT